MYVEETPIPVLAANRFSPASRRMVQRPAYSGPMPLFAGFGQDEPLTTTQKAMCDKAKALLPNMPWATSPECGLCPPPPDVSCPTPEEQGYIDPSNCPTIPSLDDYVLKTDAPKGLAWWWILVAAAGGLVVGGATGYYSAKKPGPKVI